jgi:hypothetical protein
MQACLRGAIMTSPSRRLPGPIDSGRTVDILAATSPCRCWMSVSILQSVGQVLVDRYQGRFMTSFVRAPPAVRRRQGPLGTSRRRVPSFLDTSTYKVGVWYSASGPTRVDASRSVSRRILRPEEPGVDCVCRPIVPVALGSGITIYTPSSGDHRLSKLVPANSEEIEIRASRCGRHLLTKGNQQARRPICR